MRLLRSIGLLAICATAALAGPPGEATAKNDGPAKPEPRVSVALLEASNGYTVQMLTIGRLVLLNASSGRVSAAYAVRGKVSAERIDARFGDLGRIAVSISSVTLGGDRRESSDRCGPPFGFGAFRGTIRFRGEQGYTAVNTKRAFGVVFDPRAKPCPRRATGSATLGAPHLDTQLTAISKRKGTVTSFTLSRRRAGILLKASREERRKGMSIVREAFTHVGGENAFLSSGPGVSPAFAGLTAPKPFSGNALYGGGSGPSSWTGSLAAWLPGLGKVGLTGPEFATSFCRRAADETGCNPLPPVRKPFWMLQGSGSQSQAFGEARLSWSR